MNFATYGHGGQTYDNAKQRILGEAKTFGEFNKVTGYSFENLSPYGVLNFQTNHKECSWSIKQIFDYFNVDINSNIATTGQYMATVFVVQKNVHSLRWLDTILKTLAHDMYLFTDKYNPNQPHPLFKENRHDQSMISIVSKVQGSVRLSDETCDRQNWRSNKAKQWPFWSTRYR